MKKVLVVLLFVAVGAGLFALGWVCRGGNEHPASASSPAVNTASNIHASANPWGSANAPGASQPPSAFITQSDYQKLKAAREATMQTNPELQAEYKEILSDLDAQQSKLETAMIKADPKVAPIIAKLKQMRQMSLAHSAPPSIAH
jgi:hypothetical protein